MLSNAARTLALPTLPVTVAQTSSHKDCVLVLCICESLCVVWGYACVAVVSVEARRGHQMPGSWSYKLP